MQAIRSLAALAACGILVCSSGCLVTKAQLTDCEARNRALAEQHRAQLAEIGNLKVHNRNTEDRLMRTEEDLAVLEERLGASKNQLVNYEREHSALQEQLQGLAAGGRTARIPLDISKRLEALSRRFPSLQFDPHTGISKLDSDVLFDSGSADLKPGAQELTAELVRVLQAPEAAQLRVMVVGHTDDRQMAKRPARDVFPSNFHLSSARALAVADAMRRAGLPDQRLGVAGMGGHQSVAPNSTAQERQKNRRVEIFVLPPDVPIVGWTDSMPSVY